MTDQLETQQADSTSSPVGETDGSGVQFAGGRLALLLLALVGIGYLNPWMLLVITALVVMIFLHELGHYVMARRADMKVTEFFLFFGPKIWSFRRGETEYGIKCIPAGAYVKIIGMSNLEEVSPEDEARTYRQKPFRHRFGVAVAGSTMHFILALGLLFVALTAIGQPAGTFDPDTQARNWQIREVIPGSGASEAGIVEGDRITAIDGTPIATFDDLREVLEPLRGTDATVPISYVRDGEVSETQILLRDYTYQGRTSNGFGVVLGSPDVEKVNPAKALVQTPVEFTRITRMSLEALGRFFTPGGISDFAGQVGSARADRAALQNAEANTPPPEVSENRLISIWGLIRLGSDAGSVDPSSLIVLFALINIFIGVFNLLPLLPFDGGHVVIAVYEKVQEMRTGTRRYFADLRRWEPLVYGVVILLGMLFVSTLWLDIVNPLEVR